MKKLKKKHILVLKTLFFFLVLFFTLFFGERQYEYIMSSPYDVIVSDINSDSAVISWKTKNDVPTHILLNETTLLGSGVREKFHRVDLEDLKDTTEYTFSIFNGKRVWNSSLVENSSHLENFVKKEFLFTTKGQKDELSLPSHLTLKLLPNELVYVTLFDNNTGQYSDIRSTYANRYGGAVFVKENFELENNAKSSLKNINYFSIAHHTQTLIPKVYSEQINCNQNIPYIASNAISREAFTDLANRWIAGRGKNYAYECYNDVVYRAKKVGVDPAFVLTMWLKESGASNYIWKPENIGTVEDWGIHGLKSVPAENFDLQLDHFLKLSHQVSCPGLTKWEAWGNMYRYGTCNANDPAQRADGIDYYHDVQNLYTWITNGKKLPDRVTGLSKIEAIPEEIYQQKCCTIKIDSRENLIGVFRNNVGTQRCEDLFKPGSTYLGGKVEYSILLQEQHEQKSCEVKYEGVCCRLDNDIKWYPKYICEDIISDLTDSDSCNNYQGARECFFRDGKYKWLPDILSEDSIKGVTNEALCLERNKTSTYVIDIYQGVNFVGFDFTPLKNGESLYASDLLEMYPELSLVANFKNYDWIDIIVNSDDIPFAGNDFELKQNFGYLLFSDKDMKISIDGWVDSSVGLSNLNKGWTLVGGSIYTSNKDASNLILKLNEKGLNIDTVAVWSNELSSFTYRMEEKGEVYGENIYLPKNSGVFLRLEE